MSLARRLADKFINRLADVLIDKMDRRILHPRRLLHLEAQREAADYARENMSGALNVRDQEDILRIALGRMPAEGAVFEFGVGGGDSVRQIASHATGRAVHGFDSFEGLPEDWPGRHEEKGHYSLQGRLPQVPGNVTLHKGWFEETLPRFLANSTESVAFLHVDCDLYSSTRAVLDLLAERIVPGTIIVFDEYFNFISWRDHEFKAFQEFVASHDVRYRYFCWAYQQAAVVIEEIAGRKAT